MNFAKLKNKFYIDDYIKKSLIVSYGKQINDTTFKGICYSDIEFKEKDEIFKIIPERFRQYFMIGVMEVNTQIPPHTDSKILSTINIYLNTDNCLTQFYKFKNENFEKSQIENQTTGFLFGPKDLDLTDSFIATPNDAYLLDVSMPHAVIPQDSNSIYRTAIFLQSSFFNFNEVLEMLRETDNI
jgi:hypothetical protein